MPIAFPVVKRGNVFDRWLWQSGAPSYFPGASMATSQQAPNLGRVGSPFTQNNLDPGLPRPESIRTNLRRLGTMYRHGGDQAMVNPATPTNQPRQTNWTQSGDGVRRIFKRELGYLNANLSGTSRDDAGAILGFCTVLIFETGTNVFLAQTVSDVNGAWSIPFLRGGFSFLVEYKAGSPDVAGTSKNNLLPDLV